MRGRGSGRRGKRPADHGAAMTRPATTAGRGHRCGERHRSRRSRRDLTRAAGSSPASTSPGRGLRLRRQGRHDRSGRRSGRSARAGPGVRAAVSVAGHYEMAPVSEVTPEQLASDAPRAPRRVGTSAGPSCPACLPADRLDRGRRERARSGRRRRGRPLRSSQGRHHRYGAQPRRGGRLRRGAGQRRGARPDRHPAARSRTRRGVRLPISRRCLRADWSIPARSPDAPPASSTRPRFCVGEVLNVNAGAVI